MTDQRPVALIPAYMPEPVVVDTARALAASGRFQAVVVVDDGSGEKSCAIFETLAKIEGVTVLRHCVNLGKGATLKTGLNHIACMHPGAVGAVTLDADGQHLVEDVLAVCRRLMDYPDRLIMGSREFGPKVPLRSRFGNTVTRGVMRVLGGLRLRDTQTGLRGVPSALFSNLLRLKTSHYDFELDMLLKARELGTAVEEVSIQTVYIDENRSSHFNPFLDSLKIYIVFLRFNLSSLLSVLIDYSVFILWFSFSGNLFASQFVARFSAGMVNYNVNHRFVFKSDRGHKSALILYFTTLVIMGSLSYGLIHMLHVRLAFNVYLAKVLAECLLYAASFVVQRDIIFTQREDHD